MDLYVKNFPLTMEQDELRELFEAFNPISVIIIKDKLTRISLGYGFVKINNSIDAERAIEKLNGMEFQGKNLVVTEANPKSETGGSWRSANEGIEDQLYKISRSKIKDGYLDDAIIDTAKDIDGDENGETINKSEFTKTLSDDGFIRINFKD